MDQVSAATGAQRRFPRREEEMPSIGRGESRGRGVHGELPLLIHVGGAKNS